jgi:hypothetical protein
MPEARRAHAQHAEVGPTQDGTVSRLWRILRRWSTRRHAAGTGSSNSADGDPFGCSTTTGRVELLLSRAPYRWVQGMKATRLIAGAAGASLMILATPSGAPAVAPVERERYSGVDSGSGEVCGLPLNFESSFSGVASIRPAPGSDEAFLAQDKYRFTDIVTLDDGDPSTTEFVRVEAKGNFREQRAVLLGPDDLNVYVITAVDAGTFRLYGTDGSLLLQTPGNVKIRQVFDTEGDGAPGGIVLDETVVTHGPPETGDFCDVLIAELT